MFFQRIDKKFNAINKMIFPNIISSIIIYPHYTFQEKQSLENPDQDGFSSFVSIDEADLQELEENMDQASIVQGNNIFK